MSALRNLAFFVFAGLAVLLVAFPATGDVTVVNMIPKANSGETNQDSEPNLAVNPRNPQHIAGSAFTPTRTVGRTRRSL